MQNKKYIYLLGGLGSNGTIFENINIPNSSINLIKWKNPYKKETLVEYSKRLLKEVKTKTNNIIIGVSFGGIIAQEMNKLSPFTFEKTIIISSIKGNKDKTPHIKIVDSLKLYFFLNLIPNSILNPIKLSKFVIRRKGVKTKDIIKKYFDLNLSPHYIRWSLKQVIKWKNNISDNIYHLHGDNDKVFVSKYITKTKRTIFIKGGSHIMILLKNREINNKLKKIIFNESN